MDAIVWKSHQLDLLDQRQLPFSTTYLTCTTADSVAQAIRDMVVRGAPAIGVSAMYGLVLAIQNDPSRSSFERACQVLAAARPTAVNLFDAIQHMTSALQDWDWSQNPSERAEAIARAYHQDDLHKNYALAKWGAGFLPGIRRVLTHCNTGSLATSGFGTALGIVRQLHREKRLDQVFADETRPYLQGARLTQWECQQEKIPCTLVTDGMGGYLMSEGMVDCVIVGADRIAANGDTANKVGTFMLAMAANYHGIPFIVAAPSTTLDRATPSGAGIPIEQRPSSEITSVFGHPIVPADSAVFNPAFDITPGELVTAIVTEDGVFQPPYAFGK
ncbi:MAG: S-methyl-5-thioribose-1-phosphate isomerase [Acidobacteria bacterium]|nr:S-methyl-5-thioribose-1-phosphate isomerase [Acidobacteriota bacterium]MCB9397446.1 S-methyl-5-thioribose-1-phosphate isomerase [Acidobacteriota bacterium]